MADPPKPKPISSYPGGPPQEVLDEFEAALDAYIDQWISELHQHIVQYEADTGDTGESAEPST